MLTNKRKKVSKNKKKFFTFTLKNRKKNTYRKKSFHKKGKKSKKRRKKVNKGGAFDSSCKADPASFPKCGNEGCVYLINDNEVLKKQWKNYNEMSGFNLSIEGQKSAEEQHLAPKINSINDKPCDLISKIGSEQDAPCIVKRRRATKSGEKILYEEEKRKSWCRNYGVKNQCIVNDIMYNKFKQNYMNKPLIDMEKIPKQIQVPDIDTSIDGDINSDSDEGLGEMDYGEPVIHESFTNYKPVYLTDLQMERIKGITISELIAKMLETLGEERTKSLSKSWENERNDLIEKVRKLGYFSPDFNENNIMIDVQNEELCTWIDETLKKEEDITPEKIKEHFGKENILKIVDWGLLNKVNPR
jgi:hypothetical protein